MARRVSRRNSGELIIHKWWFNVASAIILLGLASLVLSYARDSHSTLGYFAAIILMVAGVNLAIRGARFASEL